MNRDWTDGGAAVDTVKVALAPVRPAEETLTVPVPLVVAVKLERAIPPDAATGDGGLKEPDRPLTEKVTGLVALVTVLPLASWMVAV